MSKTQKCSQNRANFRNKLARKHLKVSRRFVKNLLLKRQGAQ
ncbi:hypothetical protein [Microcoleus asticus]